MPNKIIYMVTDGEYSDFHVKAVFSTEELAKEYVEKQGGDIEKWELDKLAGAIVRAVYATKIQLETGDIVQEYIYKEFANPRLRSIPPEIFKQGGYQKSTKIITTAVYGSFVSQEHSRKLAVEGRQKWLRGHVDTVL